MFNLINRSSRLAIALLAFTLGLSGATSQAEIRWQHSPAKTLQSAQSSGRPILVYVSTDWCHYCQRMNRETWANVNVDGVVSQNFETLMLDGDRDERVVARLGLQGYPATLLYSPNGQFVDMRAGFMSTSQTLQWLSSMQR